MDLLDALPSKAELLDELARLRAEVERLREVLQPFARVSIPPELPDDLWTTCKSWPITISDDEVAALKAGGVELESNESRLLLWIDGVTIGMFRQARAALAPDSKEDKRKMDRISPLDCYECGGWGEWLADDFSQMTPCWFCCPVRIGIWYWAS